ncbi:MAG TPA: leucine--tRNA ligase [Pyrinomonadaceae bacterium]|nr:leucine--tRNA ligase [Pyrinomonadaceae bacterium]
MAILERDVFMGFDPATIDAKWQRYWDEHGSFHAGEHPERPKYYVLDMFPYPSGKGLHVGHVEGYTASDIVARFKRMKGFDVLHPMGWDAFGLPAEQYAIETGVHPADSTRENARTFRAQCQMLGLSYDWRREISSCEPDYYKWTQWIFLKLLEHDLAYRAEAMVNWCPALGTVLANDEVIDGKSERGGYPVIRKPMSQWMLRITAYAEHLLAGLDRIDFPESIKAMQRDRIGRSEGADISFPVPGTELSVTVFTTRPETIFGATFCVLAPEHPLVEGLTTTEQRQAVEAYKAEAASKSDLARTGADAGKTGVFTGGYLVNPATGLEVPVWVSDYVLMTYGTGAIMAVPGHDQRDWSFARKFGLPIVEVLSGGNIEEHAWEDEGAMVNSAFLDGLSSKAAAARTLDWLEESGLGRRVVRYKMRDWIFARQRYWGEPVPVIYDGEGNMHPLLEAELPLILPHMTDFTPPGNGESPLAKLDDWVNTTVPGTGEAGRRETHTMPTLAASSWYFLRFIDPFNDSVAFDPQLVRHWMPVDLYIGGAEHAVGHLLYARFFTKFLYNLGLSPVEEPFAKLVNQGMILGEDNRKMSKRYGNVVNPTDVVRQYGADTLRLYEMSLGPIDADKPWNTAAIEGSRRFLNRVWRLYFDRDDNLRAGLDDSEPSSAVLAVLHKTIDKVAKDTERLHFNTAIAQMMVFVNFMTEQVTRPRRVMEQFVLVLAPYAPHIAEEIWQRLGHTESLMWEDFPQADQQYIRAERIEIPVQINGKVRERLHVPADISEEEIRQLALSEEKVKEYVEGKEIVKFMYVPRRLITIAVR